MATIDSKLQEYQHEVGRLLDQQRSYEVRARECGQNADIVKAKIAGIREAVALLANLEAEAEKPAPERQNVIVRVPVRKRHRSLTGHWQQIMQTVDADEGFDYDTLATAVEIVGHDANRDTLRSQMSLYKTSGLVESIGEGQFRLTNAGRRAAGISGEQSPNENGPVSAGPDERDEGGTSPLAPDFKLQTNS